MAENDEQETQELNPPPAQDQGDGAGNGDEKKDDAPAEGEEKSE